jgi:hypothetical protein
MISFVSVVSTLGSSTALASSTVASTFSSALASFLFDSPLADLPNYREQKSFSNNIRLQVDF